MLSSFCRCRSITLKSELEFIVQFSKTYYSRQWMAATAGNLSVISEDRNSFFVTASGKDKGSLTPEDFLEVALSDGKPVGAAGLKPSAETSIHTAVYSSLKSVGAILHVHTVASCIPVFGLTRSRNSTYVPLPNTEILKAFGDFTEEPNFKMLVIHNFASVPEISKILSTELQLKDQDVPFFLIENHGLTVWGKDVKDANKNLEAAEFVMQVFAARNRLF